MAGESMPNDPHTRRYRALRQMILDDLGPSQRVEIRRRMARFLRELADELDEPRLRQGNAGPPGDGVRWTGADLLLGRALWRAVGEPRRVEIRVHGATTRLRPTPNGEFYVRWYGRMQPRIACKRIHALTEWAVGWRPGGVEGGAIVFDIEATEE